MMEEKYKYVINASYRDKTNLIYMIDNSVEIFLKECKYHILRLLYNWQCSELFFFIFQGAKKFKIHCDRGVVQLTNQLGAPISKQELPFLIEKYSSCGCFCVKLKIESIDDTPFVAPDASFFL